MLINTEQLLYMQISKLQFNKKYACLFFVFSFFGYIHMNPLKNYIYIVCSCSLSVMCVCYHWS